MWIWNEFEIFPNADFSEGQEQRLALFHTLDMLLWTHPDTEKHQITNLVQNEVLFRKQLLAELTRQHGIYNNKAVNKQRTGTTFILVECFFQPPVCSWSCTALEPGEKFG